MKAARLSLVRQQLELDDLLDRAQSDIVDVRIWLIMSIEQTKAELKARTMEVSTTEIRMRANAYDNWKDIVLQAKTSLQAECISAADSAKAFSNRSKTLDDLRELVARQARFEAHACPAPFYGLSAGDLGSEIPAAHLGSFELFPHFSQGDQGQNPHHGRRATRL
jgi:hypothetical protein